MTGHSPHVHLKRYVPASLSEIYDRLGSMILGAPTFIDKTLVFPDRNIDSAFDTLTQGFGPARKKLDEARYATLIDLAARAKALFADDQDDSNGKTDQGREILCEMQDVLRDARRSRVKAKLPNEDGEISGD